MDQHIEVTGLKELRRDLKKLSETNEWNKQLRTTNKQGAELVAERAKALAPVRTGKLASSIRGRGSQREGTVAAGGARVPYAGWIDFGGTIRFKKRKGELRRPYIKEGRILYRALGETRDRVFDFYEAAVTEILRAAGMLDK